MKLIVIDPNVASFSPSMRGWLDAFPHFEDLFDEIEIWATNCEVEPSHRITIRHVAQRLPSWHLHSWDYGRRVSRMAEPLAGDPQTIVQVTGCFTAKADIRYIHYWHGALLEEYRKRKATFPLPLHKRLLSHKGHRSEAAAIQGSSDTNSWWVVSRSLSNYIQAEGAHGSFEVLPNQYDESRFNHQVRDLWRDKMRGHYGFTTDEHVLLFSAYGHFERKGLLQAVQAVNFLNQRGCGVKLLVLGGRINTVKRFKKGLSQEQLRHCTFAGLVDGIERHLVAGDGFIFPSHFEAFSLSMIEAAALGLRLYLTPHYGTEMILDEKNNGRILPWNPEDMAEIILDDIKQGQFGKPHDIMGEAVTREVYAQKIRTLYMSAIKRKTGHGCE